MQTSTGNSIFENAMHSQSTLTHNFALALWHDKINPSVTGNEREISVSRT